MANAYPKCILVMRHAEKPDDDSDPNLSPAGQRRARQLATYIPETFGNPDVIIAAADSASSSRPLETMQPLAAACGLKVHMPFADNQFAELARMLLTNASYDGQEMVVCWHHGKLAPLMHALGCKQGEYPDPWDKTVFNLILKTTFAGDGNAKVEQIVEPF
jgi:broad specificity phosphatase PhoE